MKQNIQPLPKPVNNTVTCSIAQARYHFADVLGMAHFNDTIVSIDRHGKPYAAIISDRKAAFLKGASRLCTPGTEENRLVKMCLSTMPDAAAERGMLLDIATAFANHEIYGKGARELLQIGVGNRSSSPASPAV